jgi:hypothetical protein
MKKIIVLTAIGFVFLGLGFLQVSKENNPKQGEVKATATASLSTTVQTYLTFSITTGGTVAFGNLTSGTPIAAPTTGTIASATTNAANGYTVGLSDAIAASNSCLVHTDTTTYIADYAGTIATPTTWTGGVTGLGITLYAADTTKEVAWGTGTTYNDALNKYAGIPQTAATAHTAAGFKSGADTSTWAFKIDVPNTQKTGSYSGSVTFTATAVLS